MLRENFIFDELIENKHSVLNILRFVKLHGRRILFVKIFFFQLLVKIQTTNEPKILLLD
jgi:hypothetical protein